MACNFAVGIGEVEENEGLFYTTTWENHFAEDYG
jgi:hypothetical protein